MMPAMKNLFLKGSAIFVILLVATSVMMDSMQTDFGHIDFFQKHGILFLIFITILPRLTLLFSSVAFGGFFWWLGFFICPRILVASLATVAYFHTNPVLVVISWIVALGGESMEKFGIGNRKRFMVRTFRTTPPGYQYQETPKHSTLGNGDIIDAEFTKKS